MSSVPVLKARQVISALERKGFSLVHQKGSHKKFQDDNGHTVIVSDHGSNDIKPAILAKIAKQAGMTVEKLIGK